MKKNLVLNFSALLLLLLIVHYLVSEFCSSLEANLITAAMGLAIKVFVDKKFLEGLDVVGSVKAELNKFSNYFGLVAIIVAIHLAVSIITHSFEYALLDMQAKNLITFDVVGHGLQHLIIYLYGYIGMPVLLIVLGYYGASLGKSSKELSYSELAACITTGVLIVKLLLLLGGSSSFQKFSEANPSLPIGTLPLQIVFRLALYVTQSLLCALYIWVVAKIYRRFNDNDDIPPSSAEMSII